MHVEWACVLCGRHIQNAWVSLEQWICIKFCIQLNDSERCSYGQLVIGSFITTMHPTHASHLVQSFWWNIKSPRWLSPPIAQIWCSVTFGFSQNWNHLWKGRYFRPLMRFRKIRQGSWWWLGGMCEVPRCLLWRGLRHHCPMYNASCILYLL